MHHRIALVVAASCAFLAACALSTAQAAAASAEFCPASVGPLHALDGSAAASLYSFALDASAARLASADVAIETNTGWFEAHVSHVTIAERDERLRDPVVNFVRRTFTSAPLYVRFPSAVDVLGAFVLDAQAPDDAAWASRGLVTCDAPAGFGRAYVPDKNGRFTVTALNPRTDLYAMPEPGATIAAARSIAAPGSTSCPVPFARSKVEHIEAAVFPPGYSVTQTVEVAVKIDLDPNGSLAGEDVYVPSGNDAFDEAALRAARDSTYSAGRAFCRPAPGTYLFKVRFNP